MPPRRLSLLLLSLSLLSLCAADPPADSSPRYRDPSAPVEARVADILPRLSQEEKIAQLEVRFFKTGKRGEKLRKRLAQGAVGHIHDMARTLSIEEGANRLDQVQRHIIAASRFGIPAIISSEALHGLVSGGATVFPQAIALAATFDPVLVERVADAVAVECRARGIRQVLSPVVNIARDPRWGRTEETYGEDPFLASRIGAAFCRAFTERGVITTPKHFVANYGEGGRDSAPAWIPELLLREVYLPPFTACIREGGAGSIMSAYNSLNGIPCTANRRLLTDFLRGETGFDGFVISDAWAVGMLMSKHHLTDSRVEAAALAINAGVDVELANGGLYGGGALREALDRGLVTPETLDAAVARVLRMKFRFGIFDHPFADSADPLYRRGKTARRALALEAAEKSIVLLKNRDHTLPFGPQVKTLAVVGPLAARGLLGDYSPKGAESLSIVEGLRRIRGESLRILTAEGCSLAGSPGDEAAVSNAVALAAEADAVIVAVGIEEGEGKDRCRLGLPGRQEQLIAALAETGKPVVVVLYAGSAVVMEKWLPAADAVLDVWYPGERGGPAIAKILFGDVNPSGRLPITFPRCEGQLPLHYAERPGGRGSDYADGPGAPRFPFGYGLSYTAFRYSDLSISPAEPRPGEPVTVSFTLTNIGDHAGDEIVQLYLHRPTSPVPQPVERLIAFRRVPLAAGESRRLTFVLPAERFAFLDPLTFRPRLAAGKAEIRIGASSADIRLHAHLAFSDSGSDRSETN